MSGRSSAGNDRLQISANLATEADRLVEHS